MLLYRATTGSFPFKEKKAIEIGGPKALREVILEDDLVSPAVMAHRNHRAPIPLALTQLITRMLGKNPRTRIQSMEEVERTLKSIDWQRGPFANGDEASTRPAGGSAEAKSLRDSDTVPFWIRWIPKASWRSQAAVRQSRSNFEAGRVRRALAEVEFVLSFESKNEEALLLRVEILHRMGQDEKAIEPFDAMVEEKDTTARHVLRARAHLILGNYDEAIVDARHDDDLLLRESYAKKAFRDEDLSALVKALHTCISITGKVEAGPIVELLEKYPARNTASFRKEFSEKIQSVSAFIRKPEDLKELFDCSFIDRSLSDLQWLTRVRSLDETLLRARFDTVWNRYREQVDQANTGVGQWNRVIELEEGRNWESFLGRAEAHSWAGEADQAERDYQKAAQMNPTETRIYTSWAEHRVSRAPNLIGAVEPFDRAVQLDSTAVSLTRRAELFLQLEDYERALRDFEAAQRKEASAAHLAGIILAQAQLGRDDKMRENITLLSGVSIPEKDKAQVKEYLTRLVQLKNREGRYEEAAELTDWAMGFDWFQEGFDPFREAASHPYEQWLVFIDRDIQLKHRSNQEATGAEVQSLTPAELARERSRFLAQVMDSSKAPALPNHYLGAVTTSLLRHVFFERHPSGRSFDAARILINMRVRIDGENGRGSIGTSDMAEEALSLPYINTVENRLVRAKWGNYGQK
ncbi:MAG: hypothetical protein HY586_06980 [Candidatus Omnitrophica bacterium]|nr:hypothetical protein [Candidatus Omnitrophota bacterium]